MNDSCNYVPMYREESYSFPFGRKTDKLLGSTPLENSHNERVCHDIVTKINGSQEMYDYFVQDAGNRREIIARVSYLCGELK